MIPIFDPCWEVCPDVCWEVCWNPCRDPCSKVRWRVTFDGWTVFDSLNFIRTESPKIPHNIGIIICPFQNFHAMLESTSTQCWNHHWFHPLQVVKPSTNGTFRHLPFLPLGEKSIFGQPNNNRIKTHAPCRDLRHSQTKPSRYHVKIVGNYVEFQIKLQVWSVGLQSQEVETRSLNRLQLKPRFYADRMTQNFSDPPRLSRPRKIAGDQEPL